MDGVGGRAPRSDDGSVAVTAGGGGGGGGTVDLADRDARRRGARGVERAPLPSPPPPSPPTITGVPSRLPKDWKGEVATA